MSELLLKCSSASKGSVNPKTEKPAIESDFLSIVTISYSSSKIRMDLDNVLAFDVVVAVKLSCTTCLGCGCTWLYVVEYYQESTGIFELSPHDILPHRYCQLYDLIEATLIVVP